jgi:hypothetical protein
MRKFMLEVGVVCGFSTIMAFAEEIVVNAKGEKINLVSTKGLFAMNLKTSCP